MRAKCYFIGGHFDGQIKYQDSVSCNIEMTERIKVIKEKKRIFSKVVDIQYEGFEHEYHEYECPHWSRGAIDMPDCESPVYVYVFTGTIN